MVGREIVEDFYVHIRKESFDELQGTPVHEGASAQSRLGCNLSSKKDNYLTRRRSILSLICKVRSVCSSTIIISWHIDIHHLNYNFETNNRQNYNVVKK